MSEETTISRDFESYENGLFQLFKSKGLFFLREYLLKMSMDKVRLSKNKKTQYIPYFIYPFWEIHNFDTKKLSLAIYEFISKRKDEAFQEIEEKYEEINKELEPSFEKIQFLIDNYFYSLANYNQINETFTLQLKFIQAELRDITSALPKEIKTYYLRKRSLIRKIQTEIDKLDKELSKWQEQINKTKNLETKEKLNVNIKENTKIIEDKQLELSAIVEELDDIDNLDDYLSKFQSQNGSENKKKEKKTDKVFIICEFCGTKNEKNRTNCKYCGRKLAKLTEVEDKLTKVLIERFCSNCGSEMKGEKECSLCGSINKINLINLNFTEIKDDEAIKEGVDIFGGIVSSSRRSWKISRKGAKRTFKKTPRNFVIYQLDIEEEKVISDFPQVSDIISPLLYSIELNGVKFSYIGQLESKYIFTDSEYSKEIIEKYRKNRQSSNFNYQRSLINLQNKLYKNARKHTGKVFKSLNKDLLKEIK